MIPLYIFLGLSPQQAVATAKMNGLGSSVGGLSTFAKSGHIRKDILRVMIPITVIVGIAAPFVFVRLDSQVMQQIISVLLLLLVPTLFIKKKTRPNTEARRSSILHGVGYVLYSIVLAAQAVFGAGVGSLALFVMTLLFGASAIEANATRRAITAVLAPISFITLYIAGFVVLFYGIAGMTGALIGTRYGSQLALKQGEHFATWAMAVIVSISSVLLFISAM